MWPRRSHVLAPMIEADSNPKGINILWNEAIESSFKELKHIVSDETLLSYPDCIIPFIVQTNASDKQLGDFISQNNKSISFFSRILNPQRNYTTTEKELLAIVECLKQFWEIIFGYEINVFSDHKNMVYATTPDIC